MKALKIAKPHANAAASVISGAVVNVANLLTNDPREVATFPAGLGAVLIDLGTVRLIDTVFVGYNAFADDAFVDFAGIEDASGTLTSTSYSGSVGDNSLSVAPVHPRFRHGVIQFAAPVIGRYLYLRINGGAAGGTVGVVATGASFSAQWGHEYGAGRPIVDTSTVERLLSGGFGIDPGAIVGGYAWTFGDLQTSERHALYRTITEVGIHKPVLVIEDPDFDYGTLVAQANVTISGGGRTITKTAGGAGANASAVSAVRAAPIGISFRGMVAAAALTVGLSATPTAANDASGLAYGVTISPGAIVTGFDFTTGAMPTGASLTRASTGYRINVAGTMVSEAINVARLDYGGVSHAALGLLVEPAATNLLLQSQAFDNATWTPLNLAVAANLNFAPDGTTSADTLTPAASLNSHAIFQASVAVAGGTATHSVYVKANGYSNVALKEVGTTGKYAAFSLTGAGSVIASTANSATIQAVGGGWYQITMTITGATSQGFQINVLSPSYAPGDPNATWTPNGTSGLFVWQGQVEIGAVATSAILTTAATASRSADAPVLNWATLGVADGTSLVTYTFDDGSTQTVSTTIAGGNSSVPTNLNRARIKSATVASLGISRVTPSGTVAVAPFVMGDRIGLFYDEQRFTMYRNGVIVDAYPASPGLLLGFDSSFSAVNDQISEVCVFTPNYDDRIHWGLFEKLEAYERLNPLDTKWALSVTDWG